MKKYFLYIGFLLLIASCNKPADTSSEKHEHPAPAVSSDTLRKTLPKEVHQQVGNAHLTLKYHAPVVKGRTIWGGLVPFDEVWVTGAHRATSLETNRDLMINEVAVPAGKYALFTIPGRDQWTFIVNKKWDQHLADEYNASDDVLRLNVSPTRLDTVAERLQYLIIPVDDSNAHLKMSWEKLSISIPVQVR